MAFKVIWAASAFADRESLINHYDALNPAVTEDLANAILQRIDLLATSPLMGAVYPRCPHVRETLCGVYRIFYHVREQQHCIEILSIWHSARMDPDFPG
jgi:plasmid stabilization system protein ParE